MALFTITIGLKQAGVKIRFKKMWSDMVKEVQNVGLCGQFSEETLCHIYLLFVLITFTLWMFLILLMSVYVSSIILSNY